MSEELQNDGTWSGLKKTIIGTITTIIGGAGIWVSTTLFGGHSEDKEETKTEQVAQPAAAPVINLNLQNNNTNTNQQKQQSNNSNSNNVKQQAAPVQATPAPAPVKKEEESW